jgi:hypothetical protein
MHNASPTTVRSTNRHADSLLLVLNLTDVALLFHFPGKPFQQGPINRVLDPFFIFTATDYVVPNILCATHVR